MARPTRTARSRTGAPSSGRASIVSSAPSPAVSSAPSPAASSAPSPAASPAPSPARPAARAADSGAGARGGAGTRPARGPDGTAPGLRLGAIDALRGLAVVQMIVFHFCFDLAWFGYAHWNTRVDPFWTTWRTLIVTQFLFLCGLSVALRVSLKPGWGRFWGRWAQVAFGALLVTAASLFTFPQAYIYFGVLHFVAVATVLLMLLAPLGRWNALLGLAVLAAAWTIQDPFFNPRWLNWIGLMVGKPITEDYVPLFPWLGVALLGYAAGAWWARGGFAGAERLPAPDALAVLGRWSLTTYLVHQPVLVGLLWGWGALT